MTMKTPPTFQFYWSDFIHGTSDMTPAEVGGYIRLLCYQWDHGFVPDDDRKLCAITHCDEIAVASIRHKFGYSTDGRLCNARLEQVREAQMRFREIQSQNGKKRWENSQKTSKPRRKPKGSAMPTHKPSHCQNDALYLSTSKEVESRDRGVDEIAEEIYKRYPRKIGKAKGIEAIMTALKTVPEEKILAALDASIRLWESESREPQFIPYPATWIHSNPWEDDFSSPAEIESQRQYESVAQENRQLEAMESERQTQRRQRFMEGLQEIEEIEQQEQEFALQ